MARPRASKPGPRLAEVAGRTRRMAQRRLESEVWLTAVLAHTGIAGELRSFAMRSRARAGRRRGRLRGRPGACAERRAGR